MTRNTKLLIGGIALAAIGLGAAGAIARHGDHGGWGRHGGHHGGMDRMLCGDSRAAEMADHMLVRLEHRAKLTDAQKPAFEELKTAARSAAQKVQAACPAKPAAAADGTRPPRPSPIERLANAEAMTAAKLEAIKAVRPAAEKLYAQLSDEQKTAINARPERKWGRGKWWNRDGRHGGPDRGGADRGEGRGPDRGSDDGEPALP